jgi:hypothetical protein
VPGDGGLRPPLADTTASRQARTPGSPAGRVVRLTACLPAGAAGWAVLVFTVGTALSAGLQRHLDPSQGTQRLIELDLGEAFASAAILSLLLAHPRARPDLSRADLGVLVLCALSWFLPEFHAVYLGMTLAGAWLILGRGREGPLREIGQVWLALSLCQLWGKLAFKMFYLVIEPYEVGLMARIGRWVFPDLQASGSYLSTHAGWSVVMLEGCSAFHNLSLAGLLWLCVLKIAGCRADREAVVALATSAVLVVAINIARVLAMVPSREAYAFWHDGSGSAYVALASAAASVLPILIRVERRA